MVCIVEYCGEEGRGGGVGWGGVVCEGRTWVLE